MFSIRPVTAEDRAFWFSLDTHTSQDGFRRKVEGQTGYMLCSDGMPAGLMHYSVLWDNLPFLNLIFLTAEYRGRGFGRSAMSYWEHEMASQGYRMALISTQVDEDAQFFYRKLGYKECGCLVLSEGPMAQPMEMFMSKTLWND
jgi:GNAT superfamily N-acetyltransferase